jgi:hypothetical protein
MCGRALRRGGEIVAVAAAEQVARVAAVAEHVDQAGLGVDLVLGNRAAAFPARARAVGVELGLHFFSSAGDR